MNGSGFFGRAFFISWAFVASHTFALGIYLSFQQPWLHSKMVYLFMRGNCGLRFLKTCIPQHFHVSGSFFPCEMYIIFWYLAGITVMRQHFFNTFFAQ